STSPSTAACRQPASNPNYPSYTARLTDPHRVSGTVEYVILAPTWDGGRCLEASLEQLLASARSRDSAT
ncbi:hypothetical protein, partial [Wenjunlia tyrosinilytica]|uniref:hypothetical protein n=1 Tax=Wenjunlia tyrosinilytica TaxID=1544741 RepID=UPI001E4CDA28